MANPDSPFGLTPVRFLSGAPYNGAVNRYYNTQAGENVYIGDVVKMAGNGSDEGFPKVTNNITTGDRVVGVVVGVEPVTADSEVYRAAGINQHILVADNPDLLFEVQEDSVGAALAATDMGSVADLTGFQTGSTVTGKAAIEIDSSTATASGDGTEDVILWGLSTTANNGFGTNARWLVRLNNHAFANDNTGA